MKHMRMVVVLGTCLWLTACPTTAVKSPARPVALPAIGVADLRGARVFDVNSTASSVHVHVFRGGTLARLGHNHVMTSKDLAGRIWFHRVVERSGFDLQFPVARLIVDDPQARATAGNEFPGEISEEDREGTRKNMLRAEVLDADTHPTIRLQSVHVDGPAQSPQITTRITIKGVAHDVNVPATVSIEDDRLTASGAFDILQTDFGIEPFSIGLGALVVQDRLRVTFNIVANERV